MSRRRRLALGILCIYLLTLCWGYARLPWAAIKSLRDYRLVASAQSVSLTPANLSPIQVWATVADDHVITLPTIRRTAGNRDSCGVPFLPRSVEVTPRAEVHGLSLLRLKRAFPMSPS